MNDPNKFSCGWSNNRHSMILIRNDSFSTEEIKQRDSHKLYIRLKLTDKTVPGFILRKLVNSLLKTLKYDECFLIELNDPVASAICNELKFREKTPIGILQDDPKSSKFEFKGRHDCIIPMVVCKKVTFKEKVQEKSLIYSYFKKLILVPSIAEFKIALNDGIYGCDILLLSKNEDRPTDNFAKVYIKLPDSKAKKCSLTFEDALNTEKLGHKIYEEVKKKYGIPEESTEGFLLRMSLKFESHRIPLHVQWSNDEIQDVVFVAIQDHRTRCLAQLLESFQIKDYVLSLLKDPDKIKGKLNDLDYTFLQKSFQTVNIKIKSIKEIQDGRMLLFLKALATKKLKASLFYWTQLENLISSALIALYFLKHSLKLEEDQTMFNKLSQYKTIYQDLAISTLSACYKENVLSTWMLLIQQIDIWGGESCITIAMKTKNKGFIQQKACTDLNNYLWTNYKGVELQELEPGTIFKTSESEKNLTLKRKIDNFFLSPRGRCRLDSVGYILFLTAYSILLVSLLSASTFHWLEAIVIIYMAVILLREFDQMYLLGKEYRLETYNLLDVFSILLSAIAWTLRWVAYYFLDYPQIMDAARYVFSLDFIIYCLRFTEYFYENKLLGPILIKIRKMINIYIPFLFILFIFLLSYSVASESVLYPETELNRYILYYIFRKGFWAMIGDYRLDEVEVSGDECTRDPNIYRNHSMLRCPSISGRFAIPVLLGAYALFVQILMFSLIIALFNFAIDRKEAQNEMIWRYQRFLLSEQYSRCRILLPPFLPMFFWLMNRVGQPYSSDGSEAGAGIKEFEAMAGQVITNSLIDGSFSTQNYYEGDDGDDGNLSRQEARSMNRRPTLSLFNVVTEGKFQRSPRLSVRRNAPRPNSRVISDYVNVEEVRNLQVPSAIVQQELIEEEKSSSSDDSNGSDPIYTPISPGSIDFQYLARQTNKQNEKPKKSNTISFQVDTAKKQPKQAKIEAQADDNIFRAAFQQAVAVNDSNQSEDEAETSFSREVSTNEATNDTEELFNPTSPGAFSDQFNFLTQAAANQKK